MPERSPSPPPANIAMFVVIVVLALIVYPWVANRFFPPPPVVANAPAAKEKKDDKAVPDKKAGPGKNAAEKPVPGKQANDKPGGEKKSQGDKEPSGDQKAVAGKQDKAAPAVPAVGQPDKNKNAPLPEPRHYVTLGSVDPDPNNPYRMLVTLSNEGASVARLELSDNRYRDLEDRGGYLGHLVMDNTDRGPGCLVQVVGTGTPAAAAGIQPGDRVMKFIYQGTTTEISDLESLEIALRTTRPGKTVTLEILRGKIEKLTKEVELIRRPLEVIRPERKKPNTAWIEDGPLDAINPRESCPLSFLTTLQRVDDDNPKNLPADVEEDAKWEDELHREMPGVALRNVNWHVASATEKKVVFTCPVPAYHLTISKTYELAKVDDPADRDARAYHLVLSVQITNDDTVKHEVAYRLDGPNGLPVEGAWYATTKVGRTWFNPEGLRDVDYRLTREDVNVVTASELCSKADKGDKFYKPIGEATQFANQPPLFFGVDAQYFSVAMLPDAGTTAANIERAIALRMGDFVEQRKTLTNTSFRLISKPFALEPRESSPAQSYEVFAGPKRPQLLATYDISGLICYGWPIFKAVAQPMTWILDFFYGIVKNYGLAIIMLTVVVRLSFHPISRMQNRSAQSMQAIQPKLKELKKKLKGDMMAMQKAQQELMAKHNINPYAGCLPVLVQLPIFIGLYRALQVDVELRGAALLGSAVRWCSNLAAPDMLYDWSWFMPDTVNNGVGFPGFPIIGTMLGLGPYLNLFPVITLALYFIQQKVMMPPPADEQAAQMQKTMQFMLPLFGLMFFKVAAGLCLYFIATTLWGLAEKQLMPKAKANNGDADNDDVPARPLPKPDRPSNAEREAIRRKKLGKK